MIQIREHPRERQGRRRWQCRRICQSLAGWNKQFTRPAREKPDVLVQSHERRLKTSAPDPAGQTWCWRRHCETEVFLLAGTSEALGALLVVAFDEGRRFSWSRQHARVCRRFAQAFLFLRDLFLQGLSWSCNIFQRFRSSSARLVFLRRSGCQPFLLVSFGWCCFQPFLLWRSAAGRCCLPLLFRLGGGAFSLSHLSGVLSSFILLCGAALNVVRVDRIQKIRID